VLHLSHARPTRKRVGWTESVVDNEQLNKKKSKTDVATKEDIQQMMKKQEELAKKQQEELTTLITARQRQSVTLSGMSAGHIEQIQQHLRMAVQAVDWSEVAPSLVSSSSSSTSLSSIPAFRWSDENENQQADRYLPYLKQHLFIPRHLHMDSAPPSLLDTSKSRYLPFDITGTSDVMVVERASGPAPIFGTRMLMELKKKQPDAKNLYQAMGQLLAADQHTPFTPIVVLSDLNDSWTFLWLEARRLCYSRAPSRDTAFRTVQALLDHSDKPHWEAVLGRFSKTRHVMDVIDEEEAEERARQRRRPDEQAELEDEDELSEEEDEDRELRRRRAVRRMILNTPAFMPYLRPHIREVYQPPPLYPIAPPSSMFA